MSVALQLANVFPALFVGYAACTRRRDSKLYIIVIAITLSIGAVFCGLLSRYWTHTAHVQGSERSVAFLVLVSEWCR